jgi:hypothetical protein
MVQTPAEERMSIVSPEYDDASDDDVCDVFLRTTATMAEADLPEVKFGMPSPVMDDLGDGRTNDLSAVYGVRDTPERRWCLSAGYGIPAFNCYSLEIHPGDDIALGETWASHRITFLQFLEKGIREAHFVVDLNMTNCKTDSVITANYRFERNPTADDQPSQLCRIAVPPGTIVKIQLAKMAVFQPFWFVCVPNRKVVILIDDA